MRKQDDQGLSIVYRNFGYENGVRRYFISYFLKIVDFLKNIAEFRFGIFCYFSHRELLVVYDRSDSLMPVIKEEMTGKAIGRSFDLSCCT